MATTDLRVVSLCSGIGGLELAIGGRVIAFAEHDPTVEMPTREQPAAMILAEHWPHVPNVGDWTLLDTLDDLSPDVVTGGFPCQPVSTAGHGRGDTDDRWLFDHLVDLLRRSTVRPTLFLENVPGLLTLRNRPAYYRFLDGLHTLGYSVDWGVVSAAEAGAPHLRKRWFAVAKGPDAPVSDLVMQSPLDPGQTVTHLPTPTARDEKGATPFDGLTNLLPTPMAGDGPHCTTRRNSLSNLLPTALAKSQKSGGHRTRDLTDLLPTHIASSGYPTENFVDLRELIPYYEHALLPTPTTRTHRTGPQGMNDPHDLLPLPTVTASGSVHGGNSNLTHLLPPPQSRRQTLIKQERASLIDRTNGRITDWKRYQPSIDLWTAITGRPPPRQIQHTEVKMPPVGAMSLMRQLHSPFVEWFMGFPDGWTSSIPNRHALKALGNAVVPQQAALAAARLGL